MSLTSSRGYWIWDQKRRFCARRVHMHFQLDLSISDNQSDIIPCWSVGPRLGILRDVTARITWRFPFPVCYRVFLSVILPRYRRRQVRARVLSGTQSVIRANSYSQCFYLIFTVIPSKLLLKIFFKIYQKWTVFWGSCSSFYLWLESHIHVSTYHLISTNYWYFMKDITEKRIM